MQRASHVPTPAIVRPSHADQLIFYSYIDDLCPSNARPVGYQSAGQCADVQV